MSVSRLVLCLLLIAMPATIPSMVSAQEKLGPGFFKIKHVVPRVRSHAPMTVEIELDWESAQLLEGRLELEFFVGKQHVGRFDSGDLALSVGGRTFRVMLPAIKLTSDRSVLRLHAQFVTKKATIDLGDTELVVAAHWRRSFVIGVSQPSTQFQPVEAFDLTLALALEQYTSDQSQRVGLATTEARIPPEDFPASGLGCYSYDLLVLAAGGLTELKPKQLDAIASWVEGGGSLCVIPNRAMTPAHARFLNRVAGRDVSETLYILDKTGKLLPVSGTSTEKPEESREGKLEMYRTGLGRVVVLHSSPGAKWNLDSWWWREVVCFLWKVRSDQIAKIVRNGTWQIDDSPEIGSVYSSQSNSWVKPRPFQPEPIPNGDQLSNHLIPASVTGLPLWIVATILGLFLLAIAPGDYYLLGYLKLRKFTWIFFASVSVAFTLFTVELAQRYMGSIDYRTAVVFVDIGDANQIVRTSRFELLFTATQKTVETTYRDKLFTVMPAPKTRRGRRDDSKKGVRMRQTPGGGFVPDDFDEERSPGVKFEPPVLHGRMPGAFVVKQPMPKWSPRLTRVSSLDSDVPPLDFDWTSVEPSQWNTVKGRRDLRDTILKAVPGAKIMLFNGQEVRNLKRRSGTATTAQKSAAAESGSTLTTARTSASAASGTSAKSEKQVMNLIRTVCARPTWGLFSIVSQVSPNGAADFEDLSLLDTSDLSQWLLVIVTNQGDDRVVYRKLYHPPGLLERKLWHSHHFLPREEKDGFIPNPENIDW